jgi:hypothetical protein
VISFRSSLLPIAIITASTILPTEYHIFEGIGRRWINVNGLFIIGDYGRESERDDIFLLERHQCIPKFGELERMHKLHPLSIFVLNRISNISSGDSGLTVLILLGSICLFNLVSPILVPSDQGG